MLIALERGCLSTSRSRNSYSYAYAMCAGLANAQMKYHLMVLISCLNTKLLLPPPPPLLSRSRLGSALRLARCLDEVFAPAPSPGSDSFILCGFPQPKRSLCPRRTLGNRKANAARTLEQMLSLPGQFPQLLPPVVCAYTSTH